MDQVSDSSEPMLAATRELLPAATRNGRLFVASNRVMQRGETQAGGLAQAMFTLLEHHGGTWVGWSGQEATHAAVHEHELGRIRYRTFDFASTVFEGYYARFANGCLWPLLHGRVDLMRFRDSAMRQYLEVNETFATWLARELRDDDTLWVHDYHLFPLASMLRRRGVRCRIGFFLHTPLPPARTLVNLPQHTRTIGALLDYDLVGLQTPADANALRDYFRSIPGAIVDDDGADFADGHRCRVTHFPIGIDPDRLRAHAEAAAHDPDVETLRASLGDRHLLIGVDRLDYSKGLPQRLQAFGRLLTQSPQFKRNAVLLQIAPESRRDVSEYRNLSRTVQRLVGDINGHHADASWTPVRYVNQGYPHSQLAGFYRMSRVGVVTPLCDGMNLVAKEYLACQPPHDPGVLLLSEFAGAAYELRDSALLVNPFDIDGVAKAMARALEMPLAQRRARWETAMTQLRSADIHRWQKRFLDALHAVER